MAASLHRVSWSRARVAATTPGQDGVDTYDDVRLVVVDSRKRAGWWARLLEPTTGVILREAAVASSGVKNGIATITTDDGQVWQASRIGGCSTCG